MDDSQNQLLKAVIDRIIPADDFPSASGAGVMNYLARQLATDSKAFAAPLNDGLSAIDGIAIQQHKRPFAALAAELQDSVLKQIERESYFTRLVELTSEGYYADPGNGGNIDEASWKMVGFQPRLRGDMK